MKKVLYLSGLMFLSSTVFGMQQPMDQDDQDGQVSQRLMRALRPANNTVTCCVCRKPINTITPEALDQLKSLPEIKEFLHSLNLEDCDSCAMVFHKECLRNAKEDPNFNLEQCKHPELFKWRSLWLVKRGLQKKALSNYVQYGLFKLFAHHSLQKKCIDACIIRPDGCSPIQYCSYDPTAFTHIFSTLAYITMGEVVIATVLDVGDWIKGRPVRHKDHDALLAIVLSILYVSLGV